jgi:hypothetical protein
MLITANFATWSARKGWIDKAVSSIIDQVDIVRVYYNDYAPKKRNDIIQYTGEDLTDRGKFYGIGKGEIAFTCDDDLLYPPDYVESTLERMKEYPNCVVSYHGRKLKGKGLNYYRGHETYHCLQPLSFDKTIDVGGTGVMAFNTNDILPDVCSYSQQKMSDILMGLECKKKGIKSICLKHNFGWLQVLTNVKSIYNDQVMNCDEQNRLADEIFLFN